MSGQLESRHFFREQDRVQHLDGRSGVVTEGHSLFATIAWGDGTREEVNQFDPEIVVVERSGGG